MKLKITVHGVAYEVDVEVLDAGEGFPQIPHVRPRAAAQAGGKSAPPSRIAPKPAASAVSTGEGGSVTSPIAGTIVEIKCKSGDPVEKGQILLVIEAMKMKTSIAAPTAGRIKTVPIGVGDSVRENQTLVEFE